MKEYRMIRILAAVIGVLAVLASFMYDNVATYILCCLLFLASLGIFLYSKYYYGKYLILDCNASVTESTQKKVEKSGMRTIVKVLVCSFFVSLVVLVILPLIPNLPEYQLEPWEQEEQEENYIDSSQSRVNEAIQKIEKEQQPKEESFFSRILRYMLMAVCVLFIVVILAAALYKLSVFLSHKRGKNSYEYKERIVEVNDIDEYTVFVPAAKKTADFPDGNNGKVRRQFYRQVRRGAGKKKVDQSRTPQELEQEYIRSEDARLVSLYEKARYSRETVTDEEWQNWEQRKKKEQGGNT